MSSPMRMDTPLGREANSIHFRSRKVEVLRSWMWAGLLAVWRKLEGEVSLRVRWAEGKMRGGHTGVLGPVMSEGQGRVSMSFEWIPADARGAS